MSGFDDDDVTAMIDRLCQAIGEVASGSTTFRMHPRTYGMICRAEQVAHGAPYQWHPSRYEVGTFRRRR